MPSPRTVAAALLVLLLAACSHGSGRRAGPIRIVATTSTLASLARGAAGADADVRSLVPVGTSPENYQPSPADIGALHDADVLVENGAGLEGWLAGTLRNASNPHLTVVVCADGLPVANGNPHLWMDPEHARTYVAKIADGLAAADAPRANGYRAAAKRYDEQLVGLIVRTRSKLAAIPPTRRVMIVFHDAFFYYAKRFGLTDVGAIEPTAGAEPNPAHIGEIVRLARTYGVPAIFAEHEFNPKLAQTIAQTAGGLKIAYLYDDSLGSTPGVDTYIGMMDTDTDTIVNALK